jgi:adenylate kinase
VVVHSSSDITVVLAGRPGSGKGTQAQRIASRLGLTHLSTGDVVRNALADACNDRADLRACVEAGRLVDDATMVELLQEALDVCSRRGVVLDGFPRTLPQAVLLLADRRVDLVVELEVPALRVAERLAGRRRDDDAPAVVERRLHEYERSTRPMLHWLDSRVRRITIDGDRPPELVEASLMEAILATRPGPVCARTTAPSSRTAAAS